MEHGKKLMFQAMKAYMILGGAVLAIFMIGFLVGRLTIPSAALDNAEVTRTEVTKTTVTVTECVPSVVESTIPETSVPEENWIEYIATAYCPCEKCCGKYALGRPLDEDGNPIVRGATGMVLKQGVSVAADTSIHPMGTRLEIEDMGTYTVQDRGGAIKGNRLDIYFENHYEAVKFGRQTIRVRVEK